MLRWEMASVGSECISWRPAEGWAAPGWGTQPLKHSREDLSLFPEPAVHSGLAPPAVGRGWRRRAWGPRRQAQQECTGLQTWTSTVLPILPLAAPSPGDVGKAQGASSPAELGQSPVKRAAGITHHV